MDSDYFLVSSYETSIITSVNSLFEYIADLALELCGYVTVIVTKEIR